MTEEMRSTEQTEEGTKAAGRPCIAFAMDTAEEAWEHMSFEVVEEYGDLMYGHSLYTWDRGERTLLRCRKCGGYVLYQYSEYSSPFGDGDSYYEDWFPVAGPEEADALNQKYNGFAIELEFPGRCLMRTNGKLHWSEMNLHAKETEGCGMTDVTK